jgi:VWFA-related protein
MERSCGATSQLTSFPSIGVLSLLLLLYLPLHAQSAQEAPPVIHISSQLVVLDALVENKKTGELLGTLGPHDFQLAEDGASQQIGYFSHDQLPLSVVFLLDLTDTVRPALKPLAEAARKILDHLKPEDETAIMVFSSHTELLQRFTTDRSLAAAAIRKAGDMRSSDGTFIHEDMYEAIEQAMNSTVPGSRRVLVWLTDGTANFQNAVTQKTIGRSAPAVLHTKEEATEKLQRSGIVVAALIDRSAKTDAIMAASTINPFSFIIGGRVGDIRKYAELTGGPVLNSSSSDVADRLALLIDQIRNRYTLGYKPTTPKPEGTYCDLQLSFAPTFYQQHPDIKRGDLLIRTRRGYYR